MSLAIFALLAIAPSNLPEGPVSSAAAASTAAQALPSYLVQLTLRQGGAQIASSKLLVVAGKSVRAAGTNDEGAHYDVTLSVAEREGSTFLVKMDLNSSSPAGRAVHVAPATLVKAGETTNLVVGPNDEPVSLSLVVTQAPQQEGDSAKADRYPVIGSSVTTVGQLRKQDGQMSPPPQMVKTSPEVVRAFVNATFDTADRNHSGYIERSEAPETLWQGTAIHKGPLPQPGEGPAFFPDDKEQVNVMKGPAAQAAYLATMDKDADGKVSREEYQAANYPRFLSWGVPANWRGAPKVAEK